MPITCPKCGMTSHSPNDTIRGYCENCEEYTSRPCHTGEGDPLGLLAALALASDVAEHGFVEALQPDVVIDDVEHQGPLNTDETLASLGWFKRHLPRFKVMGNE